MSASSPPLSTRQSSPSMALARIQDASAGDHSSFTDSDDEDDVVMPRGRIAARMNGIQPTEDDPSSSSDEEQHAHQIYLKMKQQMMTGQTESAGPEQESPCTAREPNRSHRRLLSRQHRKNSPEIQQELNQHASNSPRSSRYSSPRLFKSPTQSPASRRNPMPFEQEDSESDSELPENPTADTIASNRVQELIARRREERLAKEAAEHVEREVKESRLAREAQTANLFEEDNDVDMEVEDKLTQQARPTRKASKKAIEEMNRETQRMARNMQLTHQAKVKKRYSMQDFLSGFNRKKSSHLQSALNSSSAAGSSDNEAPQLEDTPPSSPPCISEDVMKDVSHDTTTTVNGLAVTDDDDDDDEELPNKEDVLSSQAPKVDKGKAPFRPGAPLTSNHMAMPPPPRPAARQFRIIAPPKTSGNLSDDDDLEIVKERFPIFDNLPTRKNNDSRSMMTLRRLAHVGFSDNVNVRGKKSRPSMTPGQLELQLRQRAAEQVRQEREATLARLKAQGVIVLSEEERERDQMQIEDMYAKAVQEAEDLRKKERQAAKEKGIKETDLLASSDESEDEEYVASEDEEVAEGEKVEVELSGSEEEDEEEVDEDGEKAESLVDDEAGQDAEDETELAEDDITIADEDEAMAKGITRPRQARKRVVLDDEDEDENMPANPMWEPQEQPDSTNNDDLAAAFGFGTAPALAMETFACTMDTSQPTQDAMVDTDIQGQDSLNMFYNMPSADVPTYQGFAVDESQDFAVGDSQPPGFPARNSQETQQIRFDYTQPSLMSPASAAFSQLSEMPSPSQDVGFGLSRMPIGPAATQSTIDTVILPVPESPTVRKRGRLQKRAVVDGDSDEELPEVASLSAKPAAIIDQSNAFDVMKKAAVKPAEPAFDKKKSDAKNWVDEQAEESEDEYAGLGGASGDESDGEADEADKQMIDESDVKVNERELAAFYAEKSRVENEAQTSKLYKDLMSGALRRTRGGAFDLDSDEDEQIAERRRRKQREEARKRRLLLGDEKIGTLGANEKKEAFLRAIEDRDEDEDDDLLDGKQDGDDVVMYSQQNASQDIASAEPQALTQISGNELKRKGDDNESAARSSKRPAAAARRTLNDAFRKPTSLAEVRESLSFLIDEPHDASNEMMYPSDSDHEHEHPQQNVAPTDRAPFSARRTAAKAGVVDRLILKQASTTTESVDDRNGAMAFHSSSSRTFSAFRAPSLLKHASTAASIKSTTMPPPPALNRDESSGVRMGGSKKSSINYAAREAERRVLVEKAEKRRAENVRKIAGMRRKGGFGSMKGLAGGFE